MNEKRDAIPPAAVIALRALSEKIRAWMNDDASGYDTATELLCDVADDLDALLTHVEPPETFPIPLSAAQEEAAKMWAADDRLWTTQETVQFNLRTFARVILAARVEPPPQEQWRCFHCDEVFTDRAEAREHFGSDEGKTPACRLSAENVWQLRDLEAQNAALRHENDKLDNTARLYHELSEEIRRRTNSSGLYMYLDYIEGEKLALQQQLSELRAVLAAPPSPPTQEPTSSR